MSDDLTTDSTPKVAVVDSETRQAMAAQTLDVNILDLEEAVYASQLLLTYVAQEGIEIDTEILDTLIQAKHKIKANQVTPEFETKFWIAFNQITRKIRPVTLLSLKSTMGTYDFSDEGSKKKRPIPAQKAVFRYRMQTFVMLAFLIALQIYWIVGAEVTKNIAELFSQRNELEAKVEQIKSLKGETEDTSYLTNDRDLAQLREERNILDQEMNANYEILLSWNSFWKFFFGGGEYEGKLTKYQEFNYNQKFERLERRRQRAQEDAVGNQALLEKIQQEEEAMRNNYELDKARNKMFLSKLSAEFVLGMLQTYILPLLYGFIGAAMFVLRTLRREIKDQTYCAESDINYRLRLALGSLSGMAIGLFMSPDDAASFGAAGPLALAFLVGYNVEMLFSLMDKLIANVTKEGPSAPETQSN